MEEHFYTKIHGYSQTGMGVGLDDKGHEVEIPYAILEEEVEALPTYHRRDMRKAQILHVIKSSDHRREPLCPHFKRCGGCTLQHISYMGQKELKENLIQAIFKDLAIEDQIYPLIEADAPWCYRNKIDLSFSEDLKGEKFLGLYGAFKSHKVIDLNTCYLVPEAFMEIKKTVFSWWEKSTLQAYKHKTNKGSLRSLTIRQGLKTGEILVMLTVSGNPTFALNFAEIESFKSVFCDEKKGVVSLFLRIHQAIPGKKTEMYEMHLLGKDTIREELTLPLASGNLPKKLFFNISPSAFYQPNTLQAERLYAKALELAKIQPNDLVFDLYCGTATLGICAAFVARYVVGVELSYESALDARENAKLNCLKNVEILQGRVEDKLEELSLFGVPDVIIVDPPREGLTKEALKTLLTLNAKTIIYISCNPKKQAEDLKKLVKCGGYQVKAVQPFDQFPQTMHIENVVLCCK